MSTLPVAESRQPIKPPGRGPAATSASTGFLVGPWFDRLFVANLYWPVLLLLTLGGGEEFHHAALFWQVYFVTAPHRWITLVLVTCDRERTRGREWTFLLVGGVIVIACLTLRLSTNSLLCLGVIDYVWNAWHFASQHHGIYRIYERRQGDGPHSKWSATLEKLCFRGFLLYVIARVAGVGWQGRGSEWAQTWHQLDAIVVIIPIVLLARMAIRCRQGPGWTAGSTYLASVMSLFLAMLWAAHLEYRQLVVTLALASAVFHAVEYLAVVTWATTDSSHPPRSDLMGRMASQWTAFLAFFILFLGVTNYAFAVGYEQTWILVNLIVAFLHYAYDGMIWKSGRRRARRAS